LKIEAVQSSCQLNIQALSRKLLFAEILALKAGKTAIIE